MSDSPSVDDLLAQARTRAVALRVAGSPETADFVNELAAALRAQTAENAQLHSKRALETLLKQNAETENIRLTTKLAELGDAQDRLDENEGTIAALRQQLTEARAEIEAMRNLNIHQAERMTGLHLDAAEARAAAPQPLWRGIADQLSNSIYDALPDDTRRPTTNVVLYRADQTPTAVTREQVDSVVFQWFGSVIADWTAVNDLQVTEDEAFRAQDQLVEQLMALLAGEGSSDG